ncbi:MAG: pimeloyl-ACP methyl ester carboxylesterase [Halioglobus sp.]|jgi:pimeloyl-ACP methyl ester carboxylesterase
MEMLTDISKWISENESVLSGAAAIIVLLGVVISLLGFLYRWVSETPKSKAPNAQEAKGQRFEKITLKDLSAPAPYPIQFAKSDGLNIAYAVFGSGAHDILMAPGIISHLNIQSHMPSIRDTATAIGAFSRIICFDKRGQGLSDPSVSVPSLEERVHDIKAVMDAAGLDQVILYGISEGGPMCMQFAHDYPERVKGLILLGTTARWLQSEAYPMGIEERVLDAMPQAWGTGVLRNIFFPSVSREQMDDETYKGFERLIATRQSVRQLVDFFKLTDVRDLLPNIHCPTLVIHFTGDMAVPMRLGRAVADAIPNAEFFEVAGTDHADLSQSPEAVARVRQFADGLVDPQY